MQIKKITDLISNTTEQSLPSCVKSEILSSFENFNPEIVHSHLWESEMLISNLNFVNAKRVIHLHDNVMQLRKIKISIKKKNLTNGY